MNIILGEKERIVGQYPYVKTVKSKILVNKKGVKGEPVETVIDEKELIITNKRLIVAENTPNTASRKQIDINEITGFSARDYYKDEALGPKKLKAVLCIIFGVLFCICIIGIIFGFGIKLIKKGSKLLKEGEKHNTTCTVDLYFYGPNDRYELLSINEGVQKTEFTKAAKKSGKKNKSKKKDAAPILKYRVELNVEVVKEMVEKIGADLMAAKLAQ